MEFFPPIPLAEWRGCKETLHRFAQVVGKIRLTASVRRNHWWNVPFYLTGHGITTRPMPAEGNPFIIDFVRHQLVAASLDGTEVSFPLGLLLPTTSLTCDNPARYAKTGQFDPDSTQHALATALTSLELQECKFCRCTA